MPPTRCTSDLAAPPPRQGILMEEESPFLFQLDCGGRSWAVDTVRAPRHGKSGRAEFVPGRVGAESWQ